MAQEITALRSTEDAVGEKKWHLLYLYALASPITNYDGETVIHQTAADLPTEVVPLVSAAAKAALDAGNALFQMVGLTQTPGETDAAYLVRIRADYAARKTWFEAQVRERYARTGQSFDAT